VEQVLRQQQYQKQSRKARRLLRQHLEKMTGLTRVQVTRGLIGRYRPAARSSPSVTDANRWAIEMEASRSNSGLPYCRHSRFSSFFDWKEMIENKFKKRLTFQR
jgi:hypothetical protein